MHVASLMSTVHSVYVIKTNTREKLLQKVPDLLHVLGSIKVNMTAFLKDLQLYNWQ